MKIDWEAASEGGRQWSQTAAPLKVVATQDCEIHLPVVAHDGPDLHIEITNEADQPVRVVGCSDPQFVVVSPSTIMPGERAHFDLRRRVVNEMMVWQWRRHSPFDRAYLDLRRRLDRSWWGSMKRARTRDGDRERVRIEREARAVRLLSWLYHGRRASQGR